MAKRQHERRSIPRMRWKQDAKAQLESDEERVPVETRDISRSGAFFFTDTEMKEGTTIELVLVMPPEMTGQENKWGCCRGKVVRVEYDPVSGRTGVAVEFEQSQILPVI